MNINEIKFIRKIKGINDVGSLKIIIERNLKLTPYLKPLACWSLQYSVNSINQML